MLNELFSRMQYEPCVLMVGSYFKKINTGVFDYNWSAIVSTNCELGLATTVSNERRIIEDVMNSEDMQANLLDSRRLHIIRLFGENYPDENADEISRTDIIDQAVDKLERVSEMVKRNGIILLEDFEDPFFSHREIRRAFRNQNICRKQLYIFNCKNKDQFLKSLEEKGIATIFEESINDFFADYFGDNTVGEYDEDSQLNKYVSLYIGAENSHKPTKVEKRDLIETEGFATLLNIEQVDGIRVPEGLYEDYFYAFLKNSVREPQWYGYTYGFNIHRKYEEQLYKKAQKGLDNTGKQNNRPLLVVGQTGTGKSISLAYLAYRVFKEKKYPVIFINDSEVNFSTNLEYKQGGVARSGSSSFNALDSLIEKLENLGAKSVLLIWDTSSYSSGREKSYRLYQALLARGRKVYLVSSAYELVNREETEDIEYDEDSVMNRKFAECSAKVEISDEIEQLKQILLNKCKMNPQKVNQIIDYCSPNTNYLALLYQFFDVIRNDLSKGVFREANANLREIDPMISEKISAETRLNNLFEIALKNIESELIKAGVIEELHEIQNESQSKIDISKDDFIKCIAVGSQFKLRMPYDFSLRILGTYNPDIIRILTQSTFFVISQDMYDNYEISIRTPLEARMYIQAKNMIVQDEIDCIVKLIDMMSPSDSYGHRQEVRYCEKLIVLIGPNKTETQNRYKSGYKNIIDALKRMRIERGIWEPSLVSQEITFLREYYGNNDAFDLSIRINALKEAVSIADEVLNKSEYPGINMGIRNAIIVEASNSKILLCQLKESRDSLIYKEIRRDLRNVIRYDNLNDYAYVTLLKGSIIEYQNENDRIKQLELLESMCTVADEIVFENPDIAASEYFQRKVTEIYSYLQNTSVLEDYIEELVANGSAAGLYAVTRKKLLESNIDFKTPIGSGRQLDVCKEVYSIFKNERYKAVLEESESCQYMLLNVVWLMNNMNPIFGKGEYRITKIKGEAWREILEICNNFIYRFCNEGDNQRQLARNIRYIKALCLGQLGDYRNSLSTLKEIKEDSALGLSRVYTQHMLCDEQGNTIKFTGRLGKYDEIKRSGWLFIEEFGNNPIYFFGPHLKLSNFSEGTVLNDIEIGYSSIAPKAFRRIENGEG